MADETAHCCPLCGKRFTSGEMKGCSGCLFSRRCDLICCPHCGYSYKEQSTIVNRLKKFFRKEG
jgi:hypothetical protein